MQKKGHCVPTVQPVLFIPGRKNNDERPEAVSLDTRNAHIYSILIREQLALVATNSTNGIFRHIVDHDSLVATLLTFCK